VQNRVQALSPDAQVRFASFQRHRRSFLPKILQGEMSISLPEQETTPPGFETDIQDKSSDKDKLKDPETSSVVLDDVPESVEGTASKELGSPITTLTPL
jgi:hypothetical protein